MPESVVAPAAGETRSHWPPTAAAHLDDALFLAGALAWCAGAIHIEAAISVVSENLPFCVLFACLAILQFLLGLTIIRRPERKVLVLGAVLSLAIVGLWIASRVGSFRIGADPVTPTGFVASVDEVILALVVARHLRAERGGALMHPLKQLLTVAGTFFVLLSCLMLTFGSSSTNVPGPVTFLCHLG